MNKEVFAYHSSDGNSRVSANIYTPDEGVVVRAVVQLSHGMCEYVSRYEAFARELCGKGIVFCGNDHLGHKNTARLNREKLGFFGAFGSRRFLMEDLELFRREMAQRYPGVPYFLMGHSMGSFIARLYAQRFGAQLDGLIISGTAGKNPAAPAGRAMARAICAAKGPRYVSKTLFQLANGAYGKAFPEDGPVGWLSRDPQICAAYLRDPYCNFKFTASAYSELFAMVEECNSGKWYREMPRHLPVFLLSGDHDPVGEMGAGPKEVYEGLMKAGMCDVRLKLYPDGRHEMLNELNKQEVYADIEAWLDEMMRQMVPIEE